MGLLDELQAAEKKNNGCRVRVLLDTLDSGEAEELAAALGNPIFHNTTIIAVLGRRGHTVTKHSLSRHRRGECGCA